MTKEFYIRQRINPHTSAFDSSALILILARWRDEAEKARQSSRDAQSVGDKAWREVMLMKAMLLDLCASEVEGAGKKENEQS